MTTAWPDHSYVSHRRARAIRVEIDSERAAAVAFGEIPASGPLGRATGRYDGEGAPACSAAARPEYSAPSPLSCVPAGAPSPVPAGGDLHTCRWCGATPTRRFLNGWLCVGCAPPAVPVPDPKCTAAALRARHDRFTRAQRRTVR